MTAGIISHVPGGLGVFELTMVASLPQVDKTTLLSVLLLFRVLYYLVPFVLGVASFIIHEVYLRSKITHVSGLKLLPEVVIPRLLGIAAASLGALMLILSILPPSADRELMLEEILPISLIESSYLLNTLAGFLLVVLARGLYQRLNGAWHISVWLLSSSVAVLLIKGLEIEVALIGMVLLVLLYICRHYFSRHSTLMSLRLNTQTVLLLSVFMISLFWVGMFVFRHEPYSPDLWWQATGDNGARFLRSSALMAILTISYVVFSLIRFQKLAPSLPSSQSLAKAQQIVARSPYAVANLSLLGDKQLLFSESNQSFIMYQIRGRSWIVMSDPVGDESEFSELIEQFVELCYSFGATFVFYEVSERHQQIFNAQGIALLKIGEEAIVPLDDFGLQGSKNAKFRQVISRAERDGLSFEVIDHAAVPAIMAQLKAVSDEWLRDKKSAEKGFSLGYFDEHYLSLFDCAVIKYQGNIVAFANIWQSGSRHEVSIDLMRYTKVIDAEGHEVKSIMDYLFIKLFIWAKQLGFERFSLGMAPFTGIEPAMRASEPDLGDNMSIDNSERHPETVGPKWQLITQAVTKYGQSYYNFAGLRQFKDKYNPHWEPRYIGIQTGIKAGIHPIRGLTDTTLLISGGMANVIKR